MFTSKLHVLKQNTAACFRLGDSRIPYFTLAMDERAAICPFQMQGVCASMWK